MSRAIARYISPEEYAAMEEQADIRHEYFDGEIFAMSGGSNTHAILCTNAASALVSRLRGTPCRAVGSEQRVRIEATGLETYPDVSVYCQPARFDGNHREVLLSPKLIVEVLSPSTEAYDKGAKFENYKRITSLSDYILVAQDRLQVDHFRRRPGGDWLLHTLTIRDATLVLKNIGVELPLSELYDGVETPFKPPLRPQLFNT